LLWGWFCPSPVHPFGWQGDVELEVAVLGGNDRALDMGVFLRADVHGIAANDARLPVHPGGRGGAGAEAICAMVLFPIQLSKNKRPGGVPGLDEGLAEEGTGEEGGRIENLLEMAAQG